MAKAYECDNCGSLYKKYLHVDCISTKRKKVNDIKIVAFKEGKTADICPDCMISFAKKIQIYFENRKSAF